MSFERRSTDSTIIFLRSQRYRQREAYKNELAHRLKMNLLKVSFPHVITHFCVCPSCLDKIRRLCVTYKQALIAALARDAIDFTPRGCSKNRPTPATPIDRVAPPEGSCSDKGSSARPIQTGG